MAQPSKVFKDYPGYQEDPRVAMIIDRCRQINQPVTKADGRPYEWNTLARRYCLPKRLRETSNQGRVKRPKPAEPLDAVSVATTTPSQALSQATTPGQATTTTPSQALSQETSAKLSPSLEQVEPATPEPSEDQELVLPATGPPSDELDQGEQEEALLNAEDTENYTRELDSAGPPPLEPSVIEPASPTPGSDRQALTSRRVGAGSLTELADLYSSAK
jgi:hypothetical protein